MLFTNLHSSPIQESTSTNPLSSIVKNTKNNYFTVGWCERLTDFAVIFKEWIHGRMKLGDVVKSYKIPHESAVWSWRDPIPALMYVLLSPILYVKRH